MLCRIDIAWAFLTIRWPKMPNYFKSVTVSDSTTSELRCLIAFGVVWRSQKCTLHSIKQHNLIIHVKSINKRNHVVNSEGKSKGMIQCKKGTSDLFFSATVVALNKLCVRGMTIMIKTKNCAQWVHTIHGNNVRGAWTQFGLYHTRLCAACTYVNAHPNACKMQTINWKMLIWLSYLFHVRCLF